MALSSNNRMFEVLIGLIIQPLNVLAELGGLSMKHRDFIERVLRGEPSAMQVIGNDIVDPKDHGMTESVVDKQQQMNNYVSEELTLDAVDNLIEQPKTISGLTSDDRAVLFSSKCNMLNIKLSPAQPQTAWAPRVASSFTPISERLSPGYITASQDTTTVIASAAEQTSPDQHGKQQEEVTAIITTTVGESPPDQTATGSRDVVTTNIASASYEAAQATTTIGDVTAKIEIQAEVEPAINKLTVKERVSNMMARMGYKEGQGLGKEQQGIREPVQQTIQLCKNGVGFVEKPSGWTSTGIDQELMDEVDRLNAAIDPILMLEWQNIPDRRPRKKVKQSKIQPAEIQPVEIQPVEIQPVEIQPVEIQPVEEKQPALPENKAAEKPSEKLSAEQASGPFKAHVRNAIIGRIISYGNACGYCTVRSKISTSAMKSTDTKLPIFTIMEALSKQKIHSRGSDWIQVEISDHLQVIRGGSHSTVVCKNLTRNVEGKVYIDYVETAAKPGMTSPKSAAKVKPMDGSKGSHINTKFDSPPFKNSSAVLKAPLNVVTPKPAPTIQFDNAVGAATAPLDVIAPESASPQSLDNVQGATVPIQAVAATEVGEPTEPVSSDKVLPNMEVRDLAEKKLSGGYTRFTENYVCTNVSDLPPVVESYESQVFWGKIEIPLEPGQTKVSLWEKFARDRGARDENFRQENCKATANKARRAISPTNSAKSPSGAVQPAMVSLPHSRSGSSGSNASRHTPAGARATPSSSSPASNNSRVSATGAAATEATAVKITNYQPRPQIQAWFFRSFKPFGEIKNIKASGTPYRKNHQIVITFAKSECATAAATAAKAGVIGGCKMSAILV